MYEFTTTIKLDDLQTNIVLETKNKKQKIYNKILNSLHDLNRISSLSAVEQNDGLENLLSKNRNKQLILRLIIFFLSIFILICR